MARVVALGGSVAGLSSAVMLARRGHEVTVVERDPACDSANGDEAFTSWNRPGVPQFQQAHNFSARMRNLLLAHIPEVVADLVDDGVEEFNVFKAIAPPELWEPDDDEFTGLLTRRPAFERALRRVAENEPGVTVRSPAAAAGLRVEPGDDGVPRVVGATLDNGEVIGADVVLDCAGRRSPVPGWLAEHGVVFPTVEQDCGASYYTRYFRLDPDAGLPQMLLFSVRGEAADAMLLGFPGDHNAFGLTLIIRPDDAELRVLRHPWAWDAFARSFEAGAGWLDPAVATPLTDVLVMASHKNVRRHFVVDGEPLVYGLLPVGDSLCTTNPTYGWGASMAATYAVAAVDAIDAHATDLRALALAYDDAVREEADSVYRESAAMDRLRMYRITDTPIPDDDAAEMERQDVIGGIFAGSFRDPVLGRAMLRRMNLLDRPGDVLNDPEVEAHARNTLEILAKKTPRKVGPTRDELRELLAAAKPAS